MTDYVTDTYDELCAASEDSTSIPPALTSSLETAFKTIASYARDPAFHPGIRMFVGYYDLYEALDARQPAVKVAGPPPAAPSVGAITAIQTAIFDNWPSGFKAKDHANRYGCAIEIWTAPADQINVRKKGNYQFKANCALMDYKNLREQLRILKKPRRAPLDPGYLDYLGQMLAMMKERPTCYVGLLNTRISDDRSPYERGTYYHADQFIIVEIDDGEVRSAKLNLVDQHISLPAFAAEGADGKPLGGKVILQSRHDRIGFTNTWKTDEMKE